MYLGFELRASVIDVSVSHTLSFLKTNNRDHGGNTHILQFHRRPQSPVLQTYNVEVQMRSTSPARNATSNSDNTESVCIYSFLNSILQEQIKLGEKTFSGRVGTFTVLLYGFNVLHSIFKETQMSNRWNYNEDQRECDWMTWQRPCVFGMGGGLFWREGTRLPKLVALLVPAAVTGQMGEIDHKFYI